MRKIITEFDVEEQIKSQENFIKRVEENLEEERKMLDSLNLIKVHIINGGYIPLKLKDLGDAYKVNYYAMPLKNNEDIRDLFANENVLSSTLFKLSNKIDKIKKYKRKRCTAKSKYFSKMEGFPSCKGRSIEENNRCEK